MTTKHLSAAMIVAKPENYDFSEGYGDKWNVVCFDGPYCYYCAEPYPDLEEGYKCPECGEELQEYDTLEAGDEPMMNYRYPVELPYGTSPEQAALALARAHVALCLVYFDQEADYWGDEHSYYLALTGGGMDFRWDICQAYIAIGLLPPVHFCDLPDFAGTDYARPEVRATVEACLESCNILMRWTQGTIDTLLGRLARAVEAAEELEPDLCPKCGQGVSDCATFGCYPGASDGCGPNK